MKMRRYLLLLLAIPLTLSAQDQNTSLNLSDIWRKYKFYDRTTRGIKSMNDGVHYSTLASDGGYPAIVKYSYKTGKPVDTLVSAKAIMENSGDTLRFDKYQFSAGESKVLLATQTESIYRHSSKSYYYVYDLEEKTVIPVKAEGKQQLADFSPTENKVAFVHENRMHIQDFDKDKKNMVSFGKGEEDAFIAGAVDWVYEEEFSFHEGFHWSPNGRYIAYYQFDERKVPMFSMDIYGSELYPQQQEFKYPKAGEVNSIVNIHIYDVKKDKQFKVKLPEDYEYIPRINWSSEDEELVITTMNRLQNKLTLWEVDADDKEIEKMYEETAPAYLEIDDDIRFLEDESFIWTSERDGFNHIYHISDEGEILNQITKGEWSVTKFYGIDEESKTLFYQATEESPLERAVYSVKLDGSAKQKLSTRSGWNNATFSDGFTYYINRYSAAGQPTVETLHAADGNEIRRLKDNARLQKLLTELKLPQKEFFSFENREGTALNGYMIKPSNFSKEKEYPVLMFVYGGPGAQTVENRYDGFNGKWFQMLAEKGYIVVSVDNRGTGARGRDFRTVTYKELGKYETMDQIDAAKYLASQNYVDGSRIGIWGWSYGGYMSSLCITKGADVFSTAMAVAPVTNWRFYDNIYTERYMQRPQENGDGYDENSPINHVEKLEGNYLLVHGSADDNVHLQNTMRMINALVAANKQFELFIYPDKDHSIAGGNTRYHLYKKMTDFIEEKL